MSNIVEFSNFEPESFLVCLRRLYRELDQAIFPSDFNLQVYMSFFLKARGKFLAISRKKKDISLEAAARHLGIPSHALTFIEGGQTPLTDTAFLKLCKYYGTRQEALILSEKIENALMPRAQKHFREAKKLTLNIKQDAQTF